ncbi:MAG TPA: Sir2 family NAD-dependent protein deacetylase, partial [Chitinophagaceae bacterium]|nr:Sir2 family NAD-dependent protein deacetylase [Chitinophagaceae bacterium]
IVWFEEAVPEMSNAIRTAMDADIFVVIGTSLVVYPAASILHYLPPFMPVIVIDRKLPSLQRNNLHTIELPATEGVQKLNKLLRKLL